MKDIKGDELLKMTGCPEIVEFEGTWWEPVEFKPPEYKDFIWTGKSVAFCHIHFILPHLILRPANVPPRPDEKWLKDNAPKGFAATLVDKPSKTAVPYVAIAENGCPNGIVEVEDRMPERFDGWRWPVTLTPVAKVEPVVRYWKAKHEKCVAKTIDNIVTEHNIGWHGQDNVGWTPTLEHWTEISQSEYEAVKSASVKPASEPVKRGGSCDSCYYFDDPHNGCPVPANRNEECWCGTSWRPIETTPITKSLEQRIADLERRVREMEGRK